MANIPRPENDDSLELNVRYQPDMVLEGMLDATVPQFNSLTLTMGDEVYNLNRQLPDYSDASDGDILQIDDGEPVWGAVEALPEIEETDEGKVLTVDNGEASWEDAPSGLPSIAVADAGKVLTVNQAGTAADWEDAASGLPTITSADDGKVLTVSEDREVGTFIPQQTVTPTSSGGGGYSAALTNITAIPDDFTAGDTASVTINGTTLTAVYYSSLPNLGTPGFMNTNQVPFLITYSSGWTLVIIGSGSETTISATASMPTGTYSAGWEEMPESKVFCVDMTTEVESTEAIYYISDKTAVEIADEYNMGIVFAKTKVSGDAKYGALIPQQGDEWALTIIGSTTDETVYTISAQLIAEYPELEPYEGKVCIMEAK